MKSNLAIIGASGHGKVIADIALLNGYKEILFFDDNSGVKECAVINPCTKIGKGCIINTGCTVDHDNQIGGYVHVSVGAHLAGTVSIGERTWIGAGAVVSNNIDICSDCMIGAGAVVVKNIEEAGTYNGVPVRIKYTHIMDKCNTRGYSTSLVLPRFISSHYFNKLSA